MKNLLPFLVSTMLLMSCGSKTSTDKKLTDEDVALAEKIEFSNEVLTLLRFHTDSIFSRLESVVEVYDESANDFKTVTYDNGLVFNTTEASAREIVFKLKDDLRQKGYEIFISEQNFGYEADKVAVIKTADQFEIVKIKGTDGINYDIDNETLIAKLKEWNKKYPFEIIGCDQSWVEAKFKENPANMENFAKEVYEFCPDVVDQGTGTIENLAKEMQMSKTLFLWWD